MVRLTLPENSKIVEGQTFGKKVKTQFVLIFTDGTEKTIETLESTNFT